MKPRSYIRISCLLAFALSTATFSHGDEYRRLALDSVSVQQDEGNFRNLDIGGANFFGSRGNNPLGPSYALAPFRFHPRDFSLSEVESIDGATIALTNNSSLIADNGMVELFYIPDSRTDLGLNLEEDPDPGNRDACSWAAPELCYDTTYNPEFPAGIDPSDFSAAPVSLGEVEIDFGEETFTTDFDLDLPDEVAASMIERINAGAGFHIAFGAIDEEGFAEVGSFSFDTAFVRPQLTLDASGVAGTPTKDLIRQGAVHLDGDRTSRDFYASGNDDEHSEFGIANFQFSKEDFGVEEDITDIGSVQLTLHHNERNFSDGDSFELFFVSDTAEELGYDEFVGYLGRDIPGEPFPTLLFNADEVNGIVADKFSNAPISLGTQVYSPKNGGTPETFDLDLPDAAKTQLIESINAGEDFHLLIAATDTSFDVTFSGLDNAFDPGNPQLSISLEVEPEIVGLDLNADGAINADDAALICGVEGFSDLLAENGILPGDTDLNGGIEFADFLVLSTNFGSEGHFGQGDFDCSGTIDFADFLVLSTNFGQTAGTAAAVPEPNGSMLVFLSMLALPLIRKRRC